MIPKNNGYLLSKIKVLTVKAITSYLILFTRVKKPKIMTLHDAIVKLLLQTGRPMTTHEIADELNRNKWFQKGDNSKITDFQIHGRTKTSGGYSHLFNRNGTTVSLVGKQIFLKQKPKSETSIEPKSFKLSNTDKDEQYVLDLFDKVLEKNSSRQHKFDFLLGDPNTKGVSAKLPVDSYYDELKLVIEYRERQHSESVRFFDKPDRMTVSGVHRGEQRKIYDERRRQILPKHKIKLIEISYLDFNHNNQKRIIRNEEFDENIVRQKLKDYLIDNKGD